MKDIALRVGMSQPTVSRALQNDPALKVETRNRIQQAAKEMGYRPNPLLSTLMAQRRTRRRSGKYANLAIISPRPIREETPTTLGYLNGAIEQAESQGFSIEVFPLTTGMRRGPNFLNKVFHARGILGALILPESLGDNPKLSLELSEITAVAIGFSYPALRINRVCSAHFVDARLAIDKVWTAGYRRIGFAMDEQLSRQINHVWYAACLGYMEERQRGSSLEIKPYLWKRYSDHEFSNWLNKENPDAVITCGHRSIALLQNTNTHPFVHMDVSDLPQFIGGIEQDWEEIGKVAVDAVISQTLRGEWGEAINPHVIQIAGKWRDGASLPNR